MKAKLDMDKIARGLGADQRTVCGVRLGDPAEQVSALAADARASLGFAENSLALLRGRRRFLRLGEPPPKA